MVSITVAYYDFSLTHLRNFECIVLCKSIMCIYVVCIMYARLYMSLDDLAYYISNILHTGVRRSRNNMNEYTVLQYADSSS